MSNLQKQVARVTVELELTKKTVVPSPSAAEYWRPGSGFTNGLPSRSSSRASTAYGAANVQHTNGQRTSSRSPSIVASMTSTWDSMHAPAKSSPPEPTTPKARTRGYTPSHRSKVPSPSPSVVSLAPTEGEDGWWS